MDNTKDRPAVCDETASDESFLVGTREQLQAFASAIFELVSEPQESRDWHGVKVSMPRSPILTEPLCDVVLTGVVLVNSEEDRRRLVNSIRSNCDDTQIDWGPCE